MFITPSRRGRHTVHLGLACLLGLALNGGAFGETLSGEVVGLTDGDTITVLDSSKTQHKVRLAAIDAPEKRQSFGDRSRQHLSALVFRRQVVVEWHKKDRYGRIVGKVLVATTDAGLAQVRAGMAWHYTAYAKEQSAADRTAYSTAEASAKSAGLGLWSDGDPTPPWGFRKARKAKTDNN